MSTLSFMNGSAQASPRAVEPSPATPRRAAGLADDAGHIIAQIPNLEPAAGISQKAKRADGRIIGQETSMKLIFGVGICLVIGAILPFLFSHGGHPPAVKELPAWDTHGVQSPAAQNPGEANTANTVAPAWSPAPQPQQPAVGHPPQAETIGAVQAPPAGSYRPAALGGPSWSRPETAAPARTASQQPNNGNPNYTRPNSPVGRPDNLRETADRRNDPAAGYPNDSRYGGDPRYDSGSHASSPQGNDPRGYDRPYGNGTNGPIAAPPTNSGYPPANNGYAPANNNYAPANNAYPPPAAPDYRNDNPSYPPATQANPSLPAGGYNGYNGGGYRDQPNVEPGVAHFDGSINTPSGRTN